MFHIDGGSVACCGCYDGLTVVQVGDVASGKDALDIGSGVMTCQLDVALLIKVNLAVQEHHCRAEHDAKHRYKQSNQYRIHITSFLP